MKTLLKKWATLATVLTLTLALSAMLAACGGGGGQADEGSNNDGSAAEEQQDQSQGGEADETAEEKVARYCAGYDQMSEDWDISNTEPLTYDYVISVMGNEGEWLAYDDEDFTWVPLEGEPVPGEEIALSYSVEGVTGSVLVMWNEGKDFNTDNFSSISNTFPK